MQAFIVLSLIILAYLLPSLVAFARHHRNDNSICVINIFLGWTILGWIICLAWSFSSNVAEQQDDSRVGVK